MTENLNPTDLDRFTDSLAADVRITRLENTIRSLRGKISARDLAELSQYEIGVRHGRNVERAELAVSLERNANVLSGNGSTQDPLVRRVLRVLAAQLRQGITVEPSPPEIEVEVG